MKPDPQDQETGGGEAIVVAIVVGLVVIIAVGLWILKHFAEAR